MTELNVIEGLRQELRRGSLVLAVLAQLRTEQYGYTLREALWEIGIEIEEGPLYPMLRRLETQGLLTSEWREEGNRRKRFYVLSEAGRETLGVLQREWRGMNRALDRLLTEKKHAAA
jgi:DNA-binding PadR family transcriptional regulator